MAYCDFDGYGGFPRYVSVAERRAKALKQARKLEKRGRQLEPVILTGQRIASSFWGKEWGKNLESYMDFTCSCPDSASLCKHIAAVLYGVGARLDKKPELFFTLRSVALEELVAKSALRRAAPAKEALAGGSLEGIFGIELDRRPRRQK